MSKGVVPKASVITVDGPSGSGKGTISHLLAARLGWHFLDSGALYRVLGYFAHQRGVNLEEEDALVVLARALPVVFQGSEIFLENQNISALIRTEACGGWASMVAAIPGVRLALLARQQQLRKPPGLVADGRDMGTVVFPDAQVKLFLEASVEMRAQRRYQQLKDLGQSVSLQSLFLELSERDRRDRTRAVAPLRPAEDAVVIDTTVLSIAEVFERCWSVISEKGLGLSDLTWG